MSNDENITTYGMPMSNGAHRRAFDVDGCRVTIEPDDRDHDEKAATLAEALHGRGTRFAALELALVEARIALEKANNRIAQLEAKIPPKQPARLMRPGYVRFTENQMWLLGNRETGWASFGYRVDSWDELFRRYDVRVTAHGEDKHGLWFEVTNTVEAKS